MKRALLLLLIAAAGSARDRAITIYRDTYGVPHIYAKTDADTAFGLMYAQSEDNFWQLEEDYIRALGRAAELYGERSFSSDVLLRAFEVNKRAIDQYTHADRKLKALCDAFAAGMNYYLEKHPETK